MFDVLVYLYETYWRPDACPDHAQLTRKLSAVGFESDEIQEALSWLDGLAAAAQSYVGTQSPNGLRVYSPAEQDHLGEASIGFLSRTPEHSIVKFARKTTNGDLLELVSFNQQLLIQTPAIIEAIIANPYRTAEAERRAQETKREFFEKERGAQQIADELRAQGKEAAAEFIETAEFAQNLDDTELSFEDAILLASHIEVPDAEIDDSWLSLDLIEELYEETEEQREAIVNKILGELRFEEDSVSGERISMINRILKMNMKDRMKLAMKGDREARNVLIRDPNRIVAQAVVQNPKITENEVEKIASMRTVPEEVLRLIAINRSWARNYQIMYKLAQNPRTPLGSAFTILTRLQLRDLLAMTKNRNISDAIRKQALRLATARTGR